MNDLYDVLDCVLRSRYLAPTELPSVPFWHLLPTELRSALAATLAGDPSLKTVVPLVWQVRERLQGKPVPDRTGERSRAVAELILGLLHLRYRDGRIGADELLTRAFHVADSYPSMHNADPHDCCAAGRPFLQLRRALREGTQIGSAEVRIDELFAPYTALATECVERWGLRFR